MRDLSEDQESLWLLTVAPLIWCAHFLLTYVTAAIWCEKLAATIGLDGARMAIAAYTLLALVGIVVAGLRGYRQHSYGNARRPHDYDTAADRHRFIGFATLLLAGLSAVATLFVALSALVIHDCR